MPRSIVLKDGTTLVTLADVRSFILPATNQNRIAIDDRNCPWLRPDMILGRDKNQ
jgi:hypothetical protein